MGGGVPSSVRLTLGLSDKGRTLDRCDLCVHMHVCTHVHTQTVRPTKGPRSSRSSSLLARLGLLCLVQSGDTEAQGGAQDPSRARLIPLTGRVPASQMRA